MYYNLVIAEGDSTQYLIEA